MEEPDFQRLALDIKAWALELGFQQAGITDTQLDQAEHYLNQWLGQGRHGEMEYMARHGRKRTRPAELEPGTLRVISLRMDYQPEEQAAPDKLLTQAEIAYISRYALGRDYHKLMRQRLKKLALRIETVTGPFQYRVFVDSAPVMEKPLAEKAGLGWVGKHTNLINRKAGSWFFLGEIYTDLPLTTDQQTSSHCGSCNACIDICPTKAIVSPYNLDARLCISYLTIELHGEIPEPLRAMIGNRVYGCDDCQLICPWNRFAKYTKEQDFLPRHGLDSAALIDLFGWNEEEFLRKLEGSPIRRIGHERWLRNIAVALGNAPTNQQIIEALLARKDHSSSMVRTHVEWALSKQD